MNRVGGRRDHDEVNTKHLFLVANLVTTSKALVTTSDALVPSSYMILISLNFSDVS